MAEEFNAFAATANLQKRYIALQHAPADGDTWASLQADAAAAITGIKGARGSLLDRAPAIHGRFTQSQLDILDRFETSACQIFDNSMRAAS